MTPYYSDAAVTLYLGDCLEVLATLPEASVDACVTDPPYELGFMGKAWDSTGIAFQVATWRAVLRVLKPGGYLLACGGTRTYHRMAVAIEDAGFEMRDAIAWMYGSGFPKSLNLGEGLGTALKPAYEPIVLARAPFKGTVKANVARFGTGALNIDACRVSVDDADAAERASRNGETGRATASGYGGGWHGDGSQRSGVDLGRWPANVCLDEIAALVLDEQSGELTSGFMPAGTKREGIGYHGGLGDTVRNDTHADSGGASRFYYVAKPSREERDYGCDHLQGKSAGEMTGGRAEGSAGLNSPRAGSGRTNGGRNFHPTVKPVELMRWLVRLVTPIGGTVLDPFTGSGTTGMACRYEQRGFIGIEREADYLAIANARIAAVAPLFNQQESA